MKSYTDLKQSKKLAKVLTPESADYCWGIDDETLHYNNSPYPCAWKDYTCKEYYIPCWSLAALLEYLREIDFFPDIIDSGDLVLMDTLYYNNEDMHFFRVEGKTILDACYETILKLHELKLL